MDFFERQDRARRKTWLLVFYLLLAVATISVLLNLVVYFLVVQGGYWVGEGASYLTRPGELAAGLGSWFTQPLSFAVTGTVMVTVLLGSGFKYLQLRGGGRAVAEMVGAREIDFTSHDPAERQLINVVEEMAIASGTPVPALFLLDEEPGINAFVAGYRPTEAVMVVTRGTVETLSRDELQGVVGHEFSHILNGDMRLNVRLMAILAGVLMLGVIGRFLLYGSFGHHRRRGYGVMSSGRGRSRSNAGVVILGIALLVLGYVGLFFGRLVKAAVSRQREFLADASSVQFTRNPDGIAGALWKIQQHQAGSLLSGRHAEDTSHMCFGESVTAGFIGWMATHPPPDERIHAVDPHFAAKRAGAKFKAGAAASTSAPSAASPVPAMAAGFAGGQPDAGRDASPINTTTAAVVGSVGTPRPEHMEYAHALHEAIPQALLASARAPQGAKNVVFALMLGDVQAGRESVALALLRHRETEAAAELVQSLGETVGALGDRYRLPLLELAMPALKRLDANDREHFLDSVEKLSRVDRQVTLFELVVLTLARKHLDPDAPRADRVEYLKFDPVIDEVRQLLTLVAAAGASNAAQMNDAFRRGALGFGDRPLTPVPLSECSPVVMPAVLAKLALLSPMLKRPVLSACVDCVLQDGKVTVAEGELVRAVAASLDCPVPPLIA